MKHKWMMKGFCILLMAALVLESTGISEAAKKAKLAQKKVTIQVGKKKSIKILKKVKGAKYIFASSNKRVVKVSKKGVLTAVKAGNAKVSVKEKKGKKVRSLGKVNVKVEIKKKNTVVDVPSEKQTPIPTQNASGTISQSPAPTASPTPSEMPTQEPSQTPAELPSDEIVYPTGEIITLHVSITKSETVESEAGKVTMLSFDGTTETEWFTGETLPGGVDTQTQWSGQNNILSARYILEGTDDAGEKCRIYIENNGEDVNGVVKTVPTVITNSESLAWLEKADLYGKLDFDTSGPVIRVISTGKAKK